MKTLTGPDGSVRPARLRLLVATSNEGKVREIRKLLAEGLENAENTTGADLEVLSLADLAELWGREQLGGQAPVVDNGRQADAIIKARYAILAERMEETGATFEENAVIKAKGAAQYTGLLTLAEDSGLEVDWLGGAPGVYSARYAGPSQDEAACNELLLANMRGAAEGSRTARYRAVMALASPDGALRLTSGACEGRIGFAPRGSGGFGYDPLFILPDRDVTMAELTMEEKNKISHRGIALGKMLPILMNML